MYDGRAWESQAEVHNAYGLLAAIVQDFGMFVMNAEGRITAWNAGMERITGWKEDEVRGQFASLLFTPEDCAAGIDKAEIQTSKATGRAEDVRWHLKKDGSRFFAEGVMIALRDEVGNLCGLGKVLRDATERKRQEDALRAASEALAASHQQTTTILESISDAFYALDAGFRFTYVNRRAEAWWNRSREALLGQQFWSAFPQAVGSDSSEYHLQAMASRQPIHYETVSRLVGRWLDVSIHPSDDGGLCVYSRDITERKNTEQRLSEASARMETLSMQDGLTGLSNRRALDARLAASCEEASRYRHPLSLLLLDVDHFKRFNDAHGHLAGDEVLKNVTGFLTYTVRGSDFVARYGGEEFVVILPQTKAAAALGMARRICRNLEVVMVSPLRTITASIGAATWRPTMDGPNALLAAADDALYLAKKQRNTAVHSDYVRGRGAK